MLKYYVHYKYCITMIFNHIHTSTHFILIPGAAKSLHPFCPHPVQGDVPVRIWTQTTLIRAERRNSQAE